MKFNSKLIEEAQELIHKAARRENLPAEPTKDSRTRDSQAPVSKGEKCTRLHPMQKAFIYKEILDSPGGLLGED